ncbi:class I SAM-dependent methyltransferase [Streptomyces clavuligerus]|uniref:Methyltransferase n=1 Tax=Streptomyces clavuligerus TaxID=1901 RepID=E2Q5Z9_STRCL|nr:class I SAM-dependent methyltransferase [Streptomyces clavuligerus]ANW21659.1 methyltransferase [Streptomyces clavuligerus]AXU16287.1 class I SAM-dependent methyltransferase [Streptomyces clavuligerus]EFG05159.1 methyltransferase [Streptomyces clavuligerus]MBY6306447.1 class I SAM-dependent methyltransferase [Streptomyces clavuligerus]QCS09066.1 class I SAM-dependent methyltransferase [Streptomyces clavuligerus]
MHGNTHAIANTAQAQAWNGYEGAHWATHQDRWNAINSGFDEPLLAAAAIAPGDRVLDIGCGGGATTRLAAHRAGGHGSALGLDLSAPVLERARALADEQAVSNASFVQGDAQVHSFDPGVFSAAISRFGCMFFDDPVAAFANVRSALRPGGTVAFLSAAAPGDNDWLKALGALDGILPMRGFGAPGEPGMFSLAEPGPAIATLTAAGFQDARAERVEAYGTWGRDAGEAARFLLESGPGRHLIAQIAPEDRERALTLLTERLRPYEQPGALRLRSVGLLLTATRTD